MIYQIQINQAEDMKLYYNNKMYDSGMCYLIVNFLIKLKSCAPLLENNHVVKLKENVKT